MQTIEWKFGEGMVRIDFSIAPNIHTKVPFAPVYFCLRLIIL